MSDAQRPESPAGEPASAVAPADVDGNPQPSDEVLAAQALPAVYSRSPRLIRVIVTSALVVALIGAIVGFSLPTAFLSSRLVAAGLLAIAGALVGALIAGPVVAYNERVESRRVSARRQAAIQEWIDAHPDADLSGNARTQGEGKRTT